MRLTARTQKCALPLFLTVAATFSLSLGTAYAQFNLPKPPKLPGLPSVDKIPGMDKLLKEDPPLTTALPDAFAAVPFLDDFEPTNAAPLLELPRGLDDRYLFLPGLYEITAESYCLKAGTWAPLPGQRKYDGMGYLYAPYKGPKAGIIERLVNARLTRPEVPQQDVQQLLWAIIARCKLSDCPTHLQRVARQLLTDRDLRALDDSVLGPLPPEVREKAYANLPSPVRTALEAENRIREEMRAQLASAVQPVDSAVNRVNDAGSGVEGRTDEFYQRMEKIAVLTGEPPELEPKDQIPWGRWTYHPEGYFVRCLPSGYATTLRQVYHPERFVQKTDARGRIGSLVAPNGDSIEFVYDGGGQELRLVRLSRRDVKKPDGPPVTVTVNGTGAIGGGRAVDYDQLWRDSAGVLKKQHSTFGKGNGAGNIEADLRDLAKLRYAVAAVIKADPGRDQEENAWWKGHADLVTRAWMSALARYTSGDTVVATVILPQEEHFGGLIPVAHRFKWGGRGGFGGDGGGGAGMPNPHAQRLGQSNKPKTNPNLDKARNSVNALNKGTGSFVRNNGLNIPWSLANWLVNWQFDTAQKIDNALNGDPPRPDFNTYSQPKPVPMPRVPAEIKIAPDQKVAFEAMLDALENLHANLAAGMESVDKHGGAKQAGDAKWTYAQACAVVHYKREVGRAMLIAADRIEAYRGLLEKAGGEDHALSSGEYAAYQQRLKSGGFGPDEVKAAKALGLTDAEIEASRQARIKYDSAEVVGKSERTVLKEAADALRDQGNHLMLLPDIRLPANNGDPVIVTAGR